METEILHDFTDRSGTRRFTVKVPRKTRGYILVDGERLPNGLLGYKSLSPFQSGDHGLIARAAKAMRERCEGL